MVCSWWEPQLLHLLPQSVTMSAHPRTFVGSGRIVATLLLACSAICVVAENIDPADDGAQYAWGENVGWLNAEPANCSDCGTQVNDLDLTGWIWGENIGWVSLSCVNTGTCGTASYGVANDACGNLSGYAWAENVGWINFSPSTAGVSIDPQTGEFSGTAWGENIGWITFADDAPVAYGVVTSWRRYAPTGGPEIDLDSDAVNLTISWSAVDDSDGYDVMQGSLTNLHSSGGDFETSTTDCRAENQAATSHQQALAIGTTADFFLVRAVNCGGNGTCNSDGLEQVGDRDPGIADSGTCQ